MNRSISMKLTNSNASRGLHGLIVGGDSHFESQSRVSTQARCNFLKLNNLLAVNVRCVREGQACMKSKAEYISKWLACRAAVPHHLGSFLFPSHLSLDPAKYCITANF